VPQRVSAGTDLDLISQLKAIPAWYLLLVAVPDGPWIYGTAARRDQCRWVGLVAELDTAEITFGRLLPLLGRSETLAGS